VVMCWWCWWVLAILVWRDGVGVDRVCMKAFVALIMFVAVACLAGLASVVDIEEYAIR
jgi:hypothetical protein